MRKVVSLIGLVIVLFASPARAQYGAGGLLPAFNNDSSTGTTLGKLVIQNAAGNAIIAPTGTSATILGVAFAGAGTTGQVSVQMGPSEGKCPFDGSTTAGDYVQLSASINGDCTDAGGSWPTSGAVVGYVIATNSGAGTYATFFYAPGTVGNGGGGGGGCPGGSTGGIQWRNSGGTCSGANIVGVVVGNGTSAPTALAGNTLSANQFATALSNLGVLTGTQVNFTNLAGSATNAQLPTAISVSSVTGTTLISGGTVSGTTGTFSGTVSANAVSASTASFSGLSSGQCVQAGAGGLLGTTGSACGGGGGIPNYRYVDVQCLNTSGDAALINAAAVNPGNIGKIVRTHGICDVTSQVTLADVGYEGEDAIIDCNATGIECVLVETLGGGGNAYYPHQSSPYPPIALPIDNLTVVCSSTTGTTGIQVQSSFQTFYNPQAYNCSNGITLGAPNSFLDTFIEPKIWANNTGIFGGGGSNAGEGERVIGGEVFNNGTGVYNSGVGLKFYGTHFDYNTTSMVVVEGAGGAVSECTDCYNEDGNSGSTNLNPILQMTGYNAYGILQWTGGWLQNSNSPPVQPIAKLTYSCRPGTGTPCGVSTGPAPYIRVTNAALNLASMTGVTGVANIIVCGLTQVDLSSAVVGNIANSSTGCP